MHTACDNKATVGPQLPMATSPCSSRRAGRSASCSTQPRFFSLCPPRHAWRSIKAAPSPCSSRRAGRSASCNGPRQSRRRRCSPRRSCRLVQTARVSGDTVQDGAATDVDNVAAVAALAVAAQGQRHAAQWAGVQPARDAAMKVTVDSAAQQVPWLSAPCPRRVRMPPQHSA